MIYKHAFEVLLRMQAAFMDMSICGITSVFTEGSGRGIDLFSESHIVNLTSEAEAITMLLAFFHLLVWRSHDLD